MATLQRTFKYEGDSSATVLSEVNLSFQIPTFEFNTFLRDGRPFPQRNTVGKEVKVINKKLKDDSYDIAFPNELLIGTSPNSVKLFYEYLGTIGFVNNDLHLLDALSAEIALEINGNKGNLFGQTQMGALYSLSTASEKYKEIMDRKAGLNSGVVVNESAAEKLELDLIDYIRKNVFVINKDSFLKAAIQFRSVEPRFNEYALLFIIAHLTDVSSGKPKIKIVLDELIPFLKTNFGIGRNESIATIKDIITDDLYDFPVTVPEITSAEVKGTFKIITSDNSSVSAKDFNFFNLSLEYLIQDSGLNVHPQSISFDWTSAQPTGNNEVPFTFETIITNFISGPLSIRVKCYDGSIAWENQYETTNPELQNLLIEVPLTKPLVITTGDEPTPSGGNKKLTGKVLEMSGLCKLKDLTIVIQAKKTGDTIWRIVGSAATDSSGNFSLPYPYGNYISAQALVSLTPNSPADINVYSDAEHVSKNETISDDFLYLLLQDANCETNEEEKDDCACHDVKKSNRLPGQEDLIQSDSYTQDIGGSCVNLSTPNRTINEYSQLAIVRTSDPDVANYTLASDGKGNFRLEGGLTKIVRKPIDLSNPIYWQDAPDAHANLSLYQAVTVATGHILHYNIVTKADGYSMGELLYSLPLAPGQKKEIVIFEQSHTLTGSESQTVSQRESLTSSLVNDRSITDTIAGNLSESMRGSSSATTSGVSAGFGLAGIIQGIGGAFGVSGGVANSHSTASQNSSRSLSEYFNEQFKNAINQNAQSYRELNASVISTVKEGQNYGVTTEVIANHNHCHSLTMMYFEVLRHYAIYQELTFVEECLFIPLLMTNFTRENVFKWRDVLASHLLPMPSETYLQPFTLVGIGRQHPLLRAFDAIDRIKTNYENVDFPDGAYDDEVITFITGEIYIQTNLPRPKSKYDRIKSWPIEKKSVWSWSAALIGGILGGPLGAIVGGYLNSDGSLKPDAYSVIDDYISVDANFATVPPAQCIRIKKIDQNFFEEGGFDKAQWDAYAKLLNKSTFDMLAYYFKDRLISEWDSIFYNDIAPLIFEKIAGNLSLGSFSAVDFSTETKYKGGNTQMRINLRGSGSNKKRNEISQLQISFYNAASLTNDLVTLIIKNVTVRYSTPHYNGILYSGFVGDDLVDGSTLYTPENANEKRNPKKEDEYMAQKLIVHLNSNLEYYNKVLWRALDPDRRYMLLDGFSIETYNDFGLPVGYRSLASVVKNELIGISGNSLIMPVAPGYKIDRTFVVEQPIEGPAVEIDLLEHYKPLTPIPPYRISIPSKGVFAEAVQGACDACEKVKENSSQDWNVFKTDEPTPINPVTVPVPTVTDWRAAFKDFATPIVNIQNAPATPTPGAGLAGISDLLGKSDVFKDITGLDQNQKNAMQTYLSNQQNAKDFAQMAKEIYTIGHNTEHSDKIADSIRNSPELTKEEKAKLLKDHFGQMVDGGQTKKAEQENTQNTKPSLTDAAVKAADQGKPVKATSIDSEGKSESVEIGAGNTQNYRVPGPKVPLILQGDKTEACWAAAATMMKSWKDGKTYSIQEILSMVPDEYLSKYNNNQPLLASEKKAFIEPLGMIGEPPANYTFNTYLDWMKTYGPLWITVDSDATSNLSPHAKILIGYDGDGTEENSQLVFLDPAVNGEQKESFSDFLSQYQAMVTDNPSGNLFIQIVHFKDAILGEGKNSGTDAAQTFATLKSLAKTSCEKQIIDAVSGLAWINQNYSADRGKPIDHAGFLVGMALMYGRFYALISKNERFATAMSKAPVANDTNDALNQLDLEFTTGRNGKPGLGITDHAAGAPTLRKVFTLLFGLGMQESEGQFSAGLNLDPGESAATKTSEASEAGFFQMSRSIGVGNTTARFKDIHDLNEIFTELQSRGSMLDIFKVGNNRIANPSPHRASNESANAEGVKFQKLIFTNPAFSVVLAALAIRMNRQHWGPINNRTLKITKDCYDMFQSIEAIMDANNCSAEIGFVRTSWSKVLTGVPEISATDLAIGKDFLWLVGSTILDNNVKLYSVDKKAPFGTAPIFDGAKKVLIDRTREPWLIDSNNIIFHVENDMFKKFPGLSITATDVSIDDNGNIWIIKDQNGDANGFEIVRFNVSNSSTDPIAGRAIKIFMASNNTPWVINKPGDLFSFDGTSWSQETTPEKVSSLAIGQNDETWIIGATPANADNFAIYKLHSTGDWISYDGAGIDIALDNITELPYVVRKSGDILKML
ncbi:papain-like cysteine protease family protein [Sporocytophaga myxococcoides]|uniref:papain-like cysteine protease family protein n=1 Tax=Sporocytophaga myxococcoides TaxID=153721 RepID=UPI0003FDAA2E|nr:papain-like cysteine protease family protein [Sporocytophaga myxococcoides]